MAITTKDIMIAKEVLAGRWGNGDERKTRLKNAGYDPSHIQSIVNRLAKGENVVADTPTQTTQSTTQSTAQTDNTLKALKTCLSDIENLNSFKELQKLL